MSEGAAVSDHTPDSDPLHAVVFHPRLESPGLDAFRHAHDPFSELIAEHITLLFPIPASLDRVRARVAEVAAGLEPFDIHIKGVEKTWDHWLYLAIRSGHREIVDLHLALYSGPLEEYRRSDLPFEPHIAIGFFGLGEYDPLDPDSVELDVEACDEATEEAEALEIDAWRQVDGLTIVRLDQDAGTLENLERIELG